MKVQNCLCVLMFLVFFVSGSSFGAEVDSITPRNIKLCNALSIINSAINQWIQEAVQNANAKQNGCDEEVLYEELKKSIFRSPLAPWGFRGYGVDKEFRTLLANQSFSLSLEDSIYRDITYFEGASLKFSGLTDVVNINGHLVGLDKLGHFFAQGWSYFKLTHYKENNIDQALEWGRKQEVGKFGYATTGVFSFADLVANFNGWVFWNRLLLKDANFLKGVNADFYDKPYITCKVRIDDSGKNIKIVKVWEYNNNFDLADFVDGVWSEGNNGSSYKNSVIAEKVTSQIRNTNFDFAYSFSNKCCSDARKKYGYYAKHILHPYCFNVKE